LGIAMDDTITEFTEGILMGCSGGKAGARESVKVAESWLKQNPFVLWGHKKKSSENSGFLFIHQKGEKDIIALMQYESIVPKEDIDDDMLPAEWRADGEDDLEIYNHFYRVIKVICKEIPFEYLEDRNGDAISATNMYDLVRVRINRKEIKND
jgi:hypothetical protein